VIEIPKIIELPAQLIAVIPITVARDKIQTVMVPGLQELGAALKAQGIPPTGPWFTHHLRRPADTFDFEICFPVAMPVTPAGRMKPSQRPAMTAAQTIYRGPYEGLASAWGEFMDWIIANGQTRTPELWERYLVGPESGHDSASWQTELTQPLTTG
jgi:effector-binding domain-containing protein